MQHLKNEIEYTHASIGQELQRLDTGSCSPRKISHFFQHEKLQYCNENFSSKVDLERSSCQMDAKVNHRPSERKNQIYCWLSLCALSVYTTLNTAIMHRSRQGQSNLYAPATSVFCGELVKFALSFVFCKYQQRRGSKQMCEEQKSASGPDNSLNKVHWHSSIPSLLYVFQNVLQLIASTFISPVTYQSMSQVKIVTAAIVSRTMLGRHINREQWFSILILLSSIIILNQDRYVQMQTSLRRGLLDNVDAESPFFRPNEKSLIRSYSISMLYHRALDAIKLRFVFGILAVIVACFLGSTAGVYMEKQVKAQKNLSLSYINYQLSLFGLCTSFAAVLVHCYWQQTVNPWHDFEFWAWITVITRALGGFLVAIVLKHSDSIAKGENYIETLLHAGLADHTTNLGFSTSFAIVLALVTECAIWQRPISSVSISSSALLCFSTVLYALS